ncbi:MAG: hypothetical protein JST22_18840 [Bacteroidetes bacterium]|nr:hypothetical protein [Bacteroidota bacterium]
MTVHIFNYHPSSAMVIKQLPHVTAFCILVLSSQVHAQTRIPTFDDYHTPVRMKGKPAPARPVGRDARRFRTAITAGAKEGPNFAGHYTVVTWGCGAGCQMFAIVDAKNGKVFVAPFTVSLGEHLDQTEDLIGFHPDSGLLIVTGEINEENYGKHYYAWERGELKLVWQLISIRTKVDN